jgi:alpha-D-ribose 1-methylphosphonate 5-triphosphate synthase subunit PhnH
MTPGFADATQGAQQVFRALLQAMSRPGCIATLPAQALRGIEPPSSLMSRALTATLLALLDAETSLHVHGKLADEAIEAHLRFHTGVRTRVAAQAAFVAARAEQVDDALCAVLDLGTDEAPQRGATLLVDVVHLETHPARPDAVTLVLQGPGIADRHSLAVTGLPLAFWSWRRDLRRVLPRGVDLVLTDGVRLAAVPRSTRITLED